MNNITYDNIVEVAASQVENIPQIDSSTNFWMFRSPKGIFYNQFINEKYIAIGWNAITKYQLDHRTNQALKQIIIDNKYACKVPQTAINKCKHFVSEIKEGDIALIVGKTEVSFAYIGNYYEYDSDETTIEKELTFTERESYDISDYCPYKKRRKIEVISNIDINLVPPAMYKCIVSNRHGLSNLSEYADAIISTAYDIAYYNDRLIVKYHVGQPKDINPFDFSLFTLNVVKLLADDESEVCGKYNINSEGDIVLFLINSGKSVCEFLKNNMSVLFIIHLLLFGGKGFGVEIPSVGDKILSWAKTILSLKDDTRLHVATADKLEAEVEKLKIDNEIKRELLVNIRDNKAKEYVEQLKASSELLKIKEPSEQLKDIMFEIYKDIAS